MKKHPTNYGTLGLRIESKQLLEGLNKYWSGKRKNLTKCLSRNLLNMLKCDPKILQDSLDGTQINELEYCRQATLQLQLFEREAPYAVAVSEDSSFLYVENSVDQQMRAAFGISNVLRHLIENKHKKEYMHALMLRGTIIPELEKILNTPVVHVEYKYQVSHAQNLSIGLEPDAFTNYLKNRNGLVEHTNRGILSPKHKTVTKWEGKLRKNTSLIHTCLAYSKEMLTFCKYNKQKLFLVNGEENSLCLTKVV